MACAQSALRMLAALEPSLVMPELLERAYGGLEVVNETHRTTAVLSMLGGIGRELVHEDTYIGGQKHLVPLLELCLPGIDLNDPIKTICTTMFVISTVQHIKIGDLSICQSGAPLTSDEAAPMDSDGDRTPLPAGMEGLHPVFSKAEERALTR